MRIALALAAVTLTAAIVIAAQEPTPVPSPQGQQQTPPQGGRGRGRGRGGEGTREFLGLGRQPDAALAAAGEKLYAASCAFCHGPDARGAGGPSLVRSELVLHDDRGELIGPVLEKGRSEKGMPPMAGVTKEQITQIAEYLHLLVEKSANRGLYGSLYSNDVLTGNAKAGQTFFEGPGGCTACHSAAGDLAHVGSKYQPMNLQNRWLWPGGGRGEARAVKVTVTMRSGEKVSGTLKRYDDFDVSLVDANGVYHAWSRDQVTVDIPDPLKAHRELLARYTDADVHNVTAYLASLK
jgi:cytochrome c oxidase cbb3-type subunit III